MSDFPTRICDTTKTGVGRVIKRYRYRAYPTGGQRVALARLFGCCRKVFNDAIKARQDAHDAGLPCPVTGSVEA